MGLRAYQQFLVGRTVLTVLAMPTTFGSQQKPGSPPRTAGFFIALRQAMASVVVAGLVEDVLDAALGRMRGIPEAMADGLGAIPRGVADRFRAVAHGVAGLLGGVLRALLDVLLHLGQVGVGEGAEQRQHQRDQE